MASLKMSVRHEQPFETAKAHFEKGISRAEAEHGTYIKHVAWSDDRTRARVSGPGFAVDLWVDAEMVHADGQVPFFVKFMEGPIRRWVEHTLGAPG